MTHSPFHSRPIISTLISGNDAAIWSKTNLGPTGHRHSRSSHLPRLYTVPSISTIFKCVLWGCSAPLLILRQSPRICKNGDLPVSSLLGETEIKSQGPSHASMEGGGRQSCWFCSKIPLWKSKRETACCRYATASSFVTKVQGEVFVHFQAVAVKLIVKIVRGISC
jgi:hypothetical protein